MTRTFKYYIQTFIYSYQLSICFSQIITVMYVLHIPVHKWTMKIVFWVGFFLSVFRVFLLKRFIGSMIIRLSCHFFLSLHLVWIAEQMGEVDPTTGLEPDSFRSTLMSEVAAVLSSSNLALVEKEWSRDSTINYSKPCQTSLHYANKQHLLVNYIVPAV